MESSGDHNGDSPADSIPARRAEEDRAELHPESRAGAEIPLNRHPKVLEFESRVFRAAYESIENATVPLCQRDANGELCHRSGVLIQIADMRFLVTAAHEVIENRRAERHLQLVLPEKGKRTVPLIDELFWTTIDEEEDLLIARLEPSTLTAMGNDFRFIRVRDMLFRSEVRSLSGLFLILGFPYAMVRPDHEGDPCVETWKYISVPYAGDFTGVTNYDPELHFILTYEERTRNREGQEVFPPGLSGCGIWLLNITTEGEPITAETFKLVAIQNAWRRPFEYAKGTWIDVALIAIWKHFPETQGPLRVNGFEWP